MLNIVYLHWSKSRIYNERIFLKQIIIIFFYNFCFIKNFEKPDIKEIFINGGFFVLSNKIFKFIKNDQTRFWKNSNCNLR